MRLLVARRVANGSKTALCSIALLRALFKCPTLASNVTQPVREVVATRRRDQIAWHLPAHPCGKCAPLVNGTVFKPVAFCIYLLCFL